MTKVFRQAIDVFVRIKSIIVIVAVITLIALGVGFFVSQSHMSIIESLRVNLLHEVENNQAIQDIALAVQNKNIVYAIGYTAGYNSLLGAFLSTTLVGVVFPIPLLVMTERALFIGLLYGGISGSFWYYLLLFGTILLEFGAYILSASLGINIGISIFWPEQYKTKNRWKAFKSAWIDAFRAYPIIILVLIVSAIWEIGGVYLLVR